MVADENANIMTMAGDIATIVDSSILIWAVMYLTSLNTGAGTVCSNSQHLRQEEDYQR